MHLSKGSVKAVHREKRRESHPRSLDLSIVTLPLLRAEVLKIKFGSTTWWKMNSLSVNFFELLANASCQIHRRECIINFFLSVRTTCPIRFSKRSFMSQNESMDFRRKKTLIFWKYVVENRYSGKCLKNGKKLIVETEFELVSVSSTYSNCEQLFPTVNKDDRWHLGQKLWLTAIYLGCFAERPDVRYYDESKIARYFRQSRGV